MPVITAPYPPGFGAVGGTQPTRSAYAERVIADGAVAYWRLGETSGTTAVDSVGGKNGTISGGVTLGQPGPLADGDRAMRFANPTGQVRVAASGAYQAWGTGPATIEFWMNTGTVPSTGSFWLVDTKNATTLTKGLGFDLETTPTLRFWCSDGTTNVVSLYPYSSYLNQWHHIVGVVRRGPDHLELWLDGVMKDSDAITAGADISSTSGVMLGAYTGDLTSSAYHYTGLLDEVAIYPTALTATQIAAHYAMGTQTGFTGGGPWLWIEEGEMPKYNAWANVSPSDTVDLPRLTDGVYVGTGGTVAAVMQNNQMPVAITVPSGAWIPLVARRINATNTTATGIVALNTT